MKKNVGKTDKIIRVIVAISIILFGVINHSWLGFIGVGVILPAILGSDPLYTIIGVNTKNKLHE